MSAGKCSRREWLSGTLPAECRPHYYVFDVYALDAKLKLPAGAARTELLKTMENHIIAKSTYTGMFNH